MMVNALYLVTISLAILSMLFGNNKYSTYLSTGSILALILITLEKTSLEGSIVLLMTFIVFETVCFTKKAWSFHRFNPPKTSRHGLFGITLCLTIGVTAVWTTSISPSSFSLSKLSFDGGLVKLLVPITFSMYGLLRKKKKDNA